ncbi:MAG: hypothetical protein OXC27_00445 [Caldilineaceae bacterium]|nr:hypothetical protein [Caldilineaceae bacterium]
MGLDEVVNSLFGIWFAANTILAFFAGFIAAARGRSEGGWFILTLIFGLVAILALALYPVDEDKLAATKVRRKRMRWCPFCLRAIATRAKKCPYCHSAVEPPQPKEST